MCLFLAFNRPEHSVLQVAAAVVAAAIHHPAVAAVFQAPGLRVVAVAQVIAGRLQSAQMFRGLHLITVNAVQLHLQGQATYIAMVLLFRNNYAPRQGVTVRGNYGYPPHSGVSANGYRSGVGANSYRTAPRIGYANSSYWGYSWLLSL